MMSIVTSERQAFENHKDSRRKKQDKYNMEDVKLAITDSHQQRTTGQQGGGRKNNGYIVQE